ncbi:MAG: D-lyxose/D-mannose family sugar isomerase [Opitutaceae bacterium]|nr:D-lyxose/D-mannose family sugar isomerase [Opitutaceae bacterium]
MKRSEINFAFREASACFAAHHWVLPPRPRWDITDFGLGQFDKYGLTLINLATEPEYCEKLMFARRNQTTPAHTHRKKKEDIICRAGELIVRIWPAKPNTRDAELPFLIQVNGEPKRMSGGTTLTLSAGWRVTLCPGVWHEFFPSSPQCIIGEVSTANDDEHDNIFINTDIGRFPEIIEDEVAQVTLISEKR